MIGYVLLSIFAFGLPLILIAVVVVRRSNQKRFVHFRLIDGRTKQPYAGAAVFEIASYQARSYVTSMSGGTATVNHGPQGAEQLTRRGTLDATGAFRGIFALGSGAITIQAPGITSGLLGVEAVADHGTYAREPYICTVNMGMVTPPDRPSGVSLGLAPGQVPQEFVGYMESYERPEAGGGIAWPTFQEAKANSMSGGMSRVWKIRGSVLGPGIGGNSVNVSVTHAEPVEEYAAPGS